MGISTTDFLSRFNLALAQDTFNRSNIAANTDITVGWSTASDGETWAHTGGGANPMTFAIAGNEGQVSGDTGTNYVLLGTGTDGNTRVDARFSMANTSDNFSVLFCYSGTGNNYRARYNDSAHALEIVRSQGGTNTIIATTPFTATTGSYYHLAGLILNGVLTAKIWADSSSEANATTTSVPDSTFSSGQYGLSFKLFNVAHVINVDHVVVTDTSPYGGVPVSHDFLARFNLHLIGFDAGGNLAVPSTGNSPYGFENEYKINPTTNFFEHFPTYTATDLASIGVTWMRIQVRWLDIQTAPPSWDPTTLQWNLLDEAISRCRDAKKPDGTASPIHVICPIQDAPDYVRSVSCTKCDGSVGKTMKPSDVATFADLLSARYNGQNDCISGPVLGGTTHNYGKLFIAAYQTENEFYSNPCGFNQDPTGTCGDATNWCNVHKAIVPKIKANSPTALVGAPALTTGMKYDPNNTSNTDLPYIKDWATKACKQVGDILDFFDMHFYHRDCPPDKRCPANNNLSFTERWKTIQAVTNSFKLNIPIWVCEFGYRGGTDLSVPNADVTYANQAAYMLDEFEEARTSGKNGIAKMFWFNIGVAINDTNDPSKYGQPFSMTFSHGDGSNDGTPPSPMVTGTASAPFTTNATARVKPPAWNTWYAEMQKWPVWANINSTFRDFLCRFNLKSASGGGGGGGASKDFLCRFNLKSSNPSPTSLQLPAVSRRIMSLPAVSRRINNLPPVSRRD